MNPDLMAYLQKRRAAGGPALPEFDETFANLDAVDADRWHAPLKYGPGESLPDVSAEEPEVISPPRRVVTGAPAAAPPQKSMRDMLYERLRKSASQPDTSEADNANLKTLGMWDAVTPGLTNIRNIFLQGAGLAPTAHEPSNRAQQLREYLTKKYNTQTDDLQAGAALEEKDALGKASAQAKAEAKAAADAKVAKEEAHRTGREKIQDDFETQRIAAMWGQNSRAGAKEDREARKDAEGKQLPATSLEALADAPVALAEIDKLKDLHQRLNMGGLGGKLKGGVQSALNLTSGDAAEYAAGAKRAMQGVGKILEGGKLAAGDEPKYMAMLPAPGDSPDVVKQKIDGMHAFLSDIVRKRIAVLKSAGYKTPDEESILGPPNGATIRMRFPDGSQHDVQARERADAEARGGRPI